MKTSRAKLIMLTFIALCVLYLLGCSKDESGLGEGSGHYIKFTANGRQVTYSAEDEFGSNLFSIFNRKNDSVYISVASGLMENLYPENNHISLSISNETEIQVNSNYTNNPSDPPRIEPLLFLMIYVDPNGVRYSTINNEILIPENGVLDGEITYTEVKNASLWGRFSGTVYNDNDEAVKITNGEFFVPRLGN